jgi:hypothetical protein
LLVRNFKLGEELPESLKTGFETGKATDTSWIWVVERDDKIVASLIAAPAHIVVILLRLLTTPDAHPFDVRALLLKATADIKSRGYNGYMVWADPTRDTEKALIEIVKAAGGFELPNAQVACAGRL